MSDFLKNLKNKDWQKNDQRGPGRQVYRDHIYKGGIGYDRRSDRDRRTSHHKKPQENLTTIFGNALPEMQSQLSQILENQKAQTDLFERLIMAQEGVNQSLDNIAKALCKMTGTEYIAAPRQMPPQAIPAPPSPQHDTQPLKAENTENVKNENFENTNFSDASNASKEDVLRTIVEMRNDGATFDMIAVHLEENNIPTFSNRGKWHAQTIHRLYAQNKDAF